ncbi:MAG: hypothetical protein Q8O67_09735 [Deltaproteobacteria bacterium]|nr:hypothetical protein [Deltaproteobacteria bacterium]
MRGFAGVVVVVVVVAAGCPAVPAGTFGNPCAQQEDCGSLQCRLVDGAQRCVPRRGAGDSGESCEDPLTARVRVKNAAAMKADVVVVDETIFFDGAADDGDFCGGSGLPDVSIGFRLLAESGLKITVDDPGVHVGLRRAGCAAVERFGCATSTTPAQVLRVPEGDWELVIDGRDAGADDDADEPGARVVVTRIDCAPGYLPLDIDECVGFRAMQPLLRARGDPGVGTIDDDDVIVLGGIGELGVRSDGERFAPDTESFSFVYSKFGHVGRALVFDVDGHAFSAGGNVGNDPLLDSVQVDPAVLQEPPDATGREVLDVAILDAPVVLTNEGLLEIGSELVRRLCNDDVDCGLDQQCLAQACACVSADCIDERRTTARLSVHPFAAGTRAVANGPASLVALDPGAGFRVFLRPTSGLFGEARQIDAIPRREVALAAVGRFVFAFGGRTIAPDGSPAASSTRIERVDTALEQATPVGTLPGPMDAGKAVTLRERYVVLFEKGDEALLFDTETLKLVQLPPLPVPRNHAAVVANDDGVLFLGGWAGVDDDDVPLADVQRLEVIPRGPGAAVVLPAPHCVTRALPLTGTAVGGSTVGASDRFRDDLCFSDSGVGDEHWTFTLDETRKVEINVRVTDGIAADLRVSLSEGVPCGEDSHVVACALNDLSVPELEAGTWTVSVESVIIGVDDAADGRSYTVSASVAAPESCVGDAADPADDVVTGAVELRPSLDEGFRVDGALCPGDVDHLLIQHSGGEVPLAALSIAGDVLIAPALIDEAASLAAGRVVVAGVGAFVVLNGFAGPAGFYVLRVGPLEGLRSRLEWRFSAASGACIPDDTDSLLPALDDGVNLALAPRLLSDQSLGRILCHRGDRDVVVFQPDKLGELIINVDGFGADAALFAFDPLTQQLGAPLDPVVVTEFSEQSLTLPPSLQPFALLLTLRDDSETADVVVNFDIAAGGDRCDNAEPLPGASGTLGGNSAIYRDDHNAQALGDCTGFRSPGEDRVLELTLRADETLEATVTPRGDFDVAVYLLSRCPIEEFDPVCVVGDDEGGPGNADGITFTNEGASASFFLVVDSFSGESYGYDLTWSIQ